LVGPRAEGLLPHEVDFHEFNFQFDEVEDNFS
jgi:hypothetical protein